VPRSSIRPNDYNPNIVLEDNLALLERSILVNGWTSPIVVTEALVIIDGFHRWLVAGRDPLRAMLNDQVPVVIVQHDDPAKNVYGTITHNRARGVHQLGPMKAIVKNLLAAGKTVEEIGRELGMKGEEVFRLSDISRVDFLDLMARNVTGYRPARVIVST
jgi:ParB-like chromosome segregation protein Spo0J